MYYACTFFCIRPIARSRYERTRSAGNLSAYAATRTHSWAGDALLWNFDYILPSPFCPGADERIPISVQCTDPKHINTYFNFSFRIKGTHLTMHTRFRSTDFRSNVFGLMLHCSPCAFVWIRYIRLYIYLSVHEITMALLQNAISQMRARMQTHGDIDEAFGIAFCAAAFVCRCSLEHIRNGATKHAVSRKNIQYSPRIPILQHPRQCALAEEREFRPFRAVGEFGVICFVFH